MSHEISDFTSSEPSSSSPNESLTIKSKLNENKTTKTNDIQINSDDSNANESAFIDSDTDNFLRIVESFEKNTPLNQTTHSSESLAKDTIRISETEPIKPNTKSKKSVSFNPDDEKVRKFISGEPIIDKKNPFKSNGLNANGNSSLKNKKTPPPVPAKRSTLTFRKTVTQQLREREKEKEKERTKNEANLRKSKSKNNANEINSPDEFVTTEEVLKQSKYVKTYIKNPDPYFVYDPTVLAKIKLEERASALKKPKELNNFTQQSNRNPTKPKILPNYNGSNVRTYKKCSKPNYPELANIKVKVGTNFDENYFNPAEVTKNAKKFDERVKKLHIGSDDDLDDINEPLTKSESSDDITNNPTTKDSTDHISPDPDTKNPTKSSADDIMAANSANRPKNESVPEMGTFTNTISSKEFQEYLDKKGLTLMPKKETNTPPRNKLNLIVPNDLRQTTTGGQPIVCARKDGVKKLSVFQRLLSNSIFATRRRTVPVLTPKSMNDTNRKQVSATSPTTLKRVVLERQSYNGSHGASAEQYLKRRTPNPSNNYGSKDSRSIAIARQGSLNNTRDLENIKDNTFHKPIVTQRKPIALTTSSVNLKSKHEPADKMPTNINLRDINQTTNGNTSFPRSKERQSLIPRRVTAEANRNQMFGRSLSMDRKEILRRSEDRGLENKNGSENDKRRFSSGSSFVDGKPQILFCGENMPLTTSTPIKDTRVNNVIIEDRPQLHNVPLQSAKNLERTSQWEELRAIKEHTDRELYFKVLQQQQQSSENIYDHLQPNQIIMAAPMQNVPSGMHFQRNAPHRNTFSGVIGQNQPIRIMDTNPNINKVLMQQPQVRCQSVLDDMTSQRQQVLRRGYDSETETPVIVRRKETGPPRRIGGLLTRDEILEKVKEFCRKSLNKGSSQNVKMQANYECQNGYTDLSPVSYASVETQHRSVSQLSSAPQVPLRVHSLSQAQQRTPTINANVTTTSPIYAHVVKRRSLQSNHSDLYDSPQQLLQQYAILEPTQYVLVENTEQIAPEQIIQCNPRGINAQPQYVCTNQMVGAPVTEFVRVQEFAPQTFYSRKLHAGRSTPLILDRSSQQASQIYWSPRHQRLQHDNLQQMQISPRYTPKQSYPIPAPRLSLSSRPIERTNENLSSDLNISYHQQYSPIVTMPRTRPQRPRQQIEIRNTSDWESGSEAGEVRRILGH